MITLRELATELLLDKSHVRAIASRLAIALDVKHARNAAWHDALAVTDSDADRIRAHVHEIATHRAHLADA